MLSDGFSREMHARLRQLLALPYVLPAWFCMVLRAWLFSADKALGMVPWLHAKYALRWGTVFFLAGYVPAFLIICFAQRGRRLSAWVTGLLFLYFCLHYRCIFVLGIPVICGALAARSARR